MEDIGCHGCYVAMVTIQKSVTVKFLAFRRVRDVRETSEIQVKFTIPTILPSLTSSKGEYLRVVGIHSDG